MLPLQSQSSLFTAVYGGMTSQVSSPYILSVSLSRRIALNSLTSSAAFTRVSAGAVQYFEFIWPSTTTGGAIIVLTGAQGSSSLQLPFVVVSDPITSSTTDPVLSVPRSYIAMLNSTTLNSNVRMYDIPSVCFGQAYSCVWKIMSYALVDTSGYTLAVNSYAANDHTVIDVHPGLGATLNAFADSGRFQWYVFDLNTTNLPATIALVTSNIDGNVDLYLSQSYAHPSQSTAQWVSVNDVNRTDALTIAVAGRYYVGVLAQRTSQFTLTVSVVPLPAASSSSTGVAFSSSSSSVTSILMASSSTAPSSSTSELAPASSSTASPSITSSSSSTSSSLSSSAVVSPSSTSSAVIFPSSSPSFATSSSAQVSSSPIAPTVTSSSASSGTVFASSSTAPGAVVDNETSTSSVNAAMVVAAVMIPILALVICCLIGFIWLMTHTDRLKQIKKERQSPKNMPVDSDTSQIDGAQISVDDSDMELQELPKDTASITDGSFNDSEHAEEEV